MKRIVAMIVVVLVAVQAFAIDPEHREIRRRGWFWFATMMIGGIVGSDAADPETGDPVKPVQYGISMTVGSIGMIMLTANRWRAVRYKQKYDIGIWRVLHDDTDVTDIRVGMTRSQVREVMKRAPMQINRTTGDGYTHEQWVYDTDYDGLPDVYVYIDDGTVSSYQY